MSARNQFGYDRVAATLECLGVSDPDELIPLLQSSNRRLAATACSALGSSGKKAFSTVLLAVLKGKRPSLWMPAAVGRHDFQGLETLTILKIIRNTKKCVTSY